MSASIRTEKVSELVKRNISEVINKEIRDPRLNQIIITGVKMTPDIKLAKVYFVMENQGAFKKEDVLKGFNSAKGYIKLNLAKKLKLRYMPDIKFYYDESFDYGDKIERLLKDVCNKEDA